MSKLDCEDGINEEWWEKEMAKPIRYEVSIHWYGRKRITRDCPTQGLLEWPQHKWERITQRPVGLKRAKAIADEQQQHAAVYVWQMAGKIYDNGKAVAVPTGWVAAE